MRHPPSHPLPPLSLSRRRPAQAHYDLDWSSLAQLIQQGADDPGRREFTLTLYRRDTCGTAADIGVVHSNYQYVYDINTVGNSGTSVTPPFSKITALRPLARVLSRSAYPGTRYLRCVDGKLSELANFTASPPVKLNTSVVAAGYGAAERPCCALDADSSPMYRNGTLNPGEKFPSSALRRGGVWEPFVPM